MNLKFWLVGCFVLSAPLSALAQNAAQEKKETPKQEQTKPAAPAKERPVSAVPQ